MDRIEFTKSVSNNNIDELKTLIEDYFDSTMLLYNILGEFKQPRKITRLESSNVATYSILFRSKKEAEKMHNAANGMVLTLYENKYIINCELDNNTVNAIIDYI